MTHDATTEFNATTWVATAVTRIWKSNCFFSDQKQISVPKAREGNVFLSFYT